MQHLKCSFLVQIHLAAVFFKYVSRDIDDHGHGEVAERPNAGALKAPEGKLSGGSNPSLAAHVCSFSGATKF